MFGLGVATRIYVAVGPPIHKLVLTNISIYVLLVGISLFHVTFLRQRLEEPPALYP
jgi:hypothetical protein